MEKDQRRRRRSIRNIRRRSGVVSEPLESENEESEKAIPNKENVFGSLWMETEEPIIKKKKRRSNLFNPKSHIMALESQDNVMDNSSAHSACQEDGIGETNWTNGCAFKSDETGRLKPPEDMLSKLTKTYSVTSNEKGFCSHRHSDDDRKDCSLNPDYDLLVTNTVLETADVHSALTLPKRALGLSNETNLKQNDIFTESCQQTTVSGLMSRENNDTLHEKQNSQNLLSKVTNGIGLNSPPSVSEIKDTCLNSPTVSVTNETVFKSSAQVSLNSPCHYRQPHIDPDGNEVVTPPNVSDKKMTPPSMSPEYPESPRENGFTNSHDESYLALDETERFQMNKENSRNVENINVVVNLSQEEIFAGSAKEKNSVDKTSNVESTSPSYFSITKAIGKVVEFVKTSPSYIFGYENSDKSCENLSASPVLKSIQTNNVESSPKQSSNFMGVALNDPTNSMKNTEEKVSGSPAKDFFTDTFNAVLKAFETPKDKTNKKVDEPSVRREKTKAVMSLKPEDISKSVLSSSCKQIHSSVGDFKSTNQDIEKSSSVVGHDNISFSSDPTAASKLVHESETTVSSIVCSGATGERFHGSETMKNSKVSPYVKGKLVRGSETMVNANVFTDTKGKPVQGSETMVDAKMYSETKGELVHESKTIPNSKVWSDTNGEPVHSSETMINSNMCSETIGELVNGSETKVCSVLNGGFVYGSDTFVKTNVCFDKLDDSAKDQNLESNVKEINENEVSLHEQIKDKTDVECSKSLRANTFNTKDCKDVSDSKGIKLSEKKAKNTKSKSIGQPRKGGRRSVDKEILEELPQTDGNLTCTVNNLVSSFTETTDQTNISACPKKSKGDRKKGRRSGNIDTFRTELEMFRESNLKDSEMSDDSCTQSYESQSDGNTSDSQLELKTSRRSRRRSAEAAILKIQEVTELSDKDATGKVDKQSRKRKHEIDDSEIENIYRNKNYVKPDEHKPWQTIYENTNRAGEALSKKRMTRYIDFEKPTQAKLRKRAQKALKYGWNIGSKKRIALNDDVVKERLDKLWSELDKSSPESPSLEKALRSIVETE